MMPQEQSFAFKPVDLTIRRGDAVTPRDNAVDIRAWMGQTGYVSKVGEGYDWIVDFNGSPVPCNAKELRRMY